MVPIRYSEVYGAGTSQRKSYAKYFEKMRIAMAGCHGKDFNFLTFLKLNFFFKGASCCRILGTLPNFSLRFQACSEPTSKLTVHCLSVG